MSEKDLTQYTVIVVGASAGGLEVISTIFPELKKTGRLRAAVVLHLPSQGPNLIPGLLAPQCSLTVKEAGPGEPMEADHIYVAPTDYHLFIEPNLTMSLSSEEPVNYSRPAIDLLFETAAFSCGKKTIGILLSGANHDGAAGLKIIQEQGGFTVVQNPADAEYSPMPQSALDAFTPDLVLTTDELKNFMRKISSGGKDA